MWLGGSAPSPPGSPPSPARLNGPPGDDAEGGGDRHSPRQGSTASVRHGEDLIREAPDVHTPEVHRAGWARSEIYSRDGTRQGGRTGTLTAGRVHRGHRNVVQIPVESPPEPEGHSSGWQEAWAPPASKTQ